MAGQINGSMGKEKTCVANFNSPKEHTFLKSGFATLIVLILFGFVSGVSIDSYIKVNGVNKIVHREIQVRQALYLAEGGIEWAKNELLLNESLTAATVSYAVGQAFIAIEKENEGYWVISEGKTGSSVKKIKVFLQRESDHWLFLYYQEIYS